jgi:hypothetical protein
MIAAAPAATIAPPPSAACRGAGIGTRSRKGTRWLNRRTSHPLTLAARSSSRSGLTAMACPTASSIGRSVAESLYA